MSSEYRPEDRFSFIIGHPWNEEFPNDLEVYCHHTECQYGTMEMAKWFADYAEQQTGKKHYVYKLVKVDE